MVERDSVKDYDGHLLGLRDRLTAAITAPTVAGFDLGSVAPRSQQSATSNLVARPAGAALGHGSPGIYRTIWFLRKAHAALLRRQA
jgi:hypothetical protein